MCPGQFAEGLYIRHGLRPTPANECSRGRHAGPTTSCSEPSPRGSTV
jgi:hypothetical protein